MSFLTLLLTLLALVAPAQAADVILRVRASVGGAEVFLDGKALGPVPVTTYIAPGPHSIRVVADGHDPWVRSFDAPDGKTVEVNATLVPGNGTVEWTGPSGAKLWVDGQERGQLPIRLPALTPGKHTWRVEAPTFEPAEGTIDFVFGKNYLIDVAMSPSAGIFVVESTPAGAAVFLDGVQVGTTPWRAEAIKPGPHTVELRKEGYSSVLRTVDTSDGSRGEVKATLTKAGGVVVVSTGSGDAQVFANDVLVGTGRTVTVGPLERGRVNLRVVDGDKVATGSIPVTEGTIEVRVSGDSLEKRPPLTKRWGFWAALAGGAAVAAGGATAVAVAAQPPPLPSGDTVETLP